MSTHARPRSYSRSVIAIAACGNRVVHVKSATTIARELMIYAAARERNASHEYSIATGASLIAQEQSANVARGRLRLCFLLIDR